jgi:hypothetical protein
VVHDNFEATQDFAGGGAGGGGGAGQKGNRLFGPGNPISARYFSGAYAPEPTTPQGFHNYLLGGGTNPAGPAAITRSSGLIYVSGFSGGNGLSISSNSWLGRLNSSLQTTPRNLIGQPADAPQLSSLGEPTGAGGEFYIGGGGGGAGALNAAMRSSGSYSPQGWFATYLASGGDGGRGGGGNGAMHYSLLKGLPTSSSVLNALDADPNSSSVNPGDAGYGFGATVNLQEAGTAAQFLEATLGPKWDYRDLFHGNTAVKYTGSGGGGAYRSGSRLGPASYFPEYRLNSDGVLTENGARDSRYRAEGKAGDGAPGIVILRYKV